MAFLAAALALASQNAAQAAGPEAATAFVARLYRMRDLPLTRPASEAVFATDLARVIDSDTRKADKAGEVGTFNDADWRSFAQDGRLEGLALKANPGGVVARFRLLGEARTVRYAMCRNRGGAWRIADIALVSPNPDHQPSLRALAKLPVRADC